jgi:hypothetical protein
MCIIEAGSRKPEAGSRKPEAGSRKPEAASKAKGFVGFALKFVLIIDFNLQDA